jgi:hypothetical protein
MKVSKVGVTLTVVGILGVLFLVLGCVFIHIFSQLIHDEVAENIPLKNGSQSYKMWADPSSPIYFQVWMFDLLNADEFLAGQKPDLKQKGPYTYREKRHKFDISYNKNGTLNYREDRSYVFQRDLSVGSENDTFVTMNIPMLTFLYMTQWERPGIKDVITSILNITKETLLTQLSVHDLMWGYPIKSVADLNFIIKQFGFNYTIPDMFGLFYNKNNSDDGVYQIYSGLDGVENFGKVVTWDYSSVLDYWNSNITNMINGSDGTIYPPFVNSADMKYLFSSDLCRSLGLEYNSTVGVKGIDMYKYVAPDSMFANVSVNPYNEGFCTPPGHCLPSGLLNVSACRSGAPVVMSMPHFLGCDPETVDAVVGLRPNRVEHESYVDIEPRTGVAMNVGKKLQINVFIKPMDGYSVSSRINPVVFPIMWLNESAMISDSDAADFKTQVLDKIKLTQGIQYGLIALGGLMILIVIIILVKIKLSESRQSSTAINDDEHRPLLISAA